MQVNIENFPVSDLFSRFNIGRQALYNRLEALDIRPAKVGNRSYVDSFQLDRLDSLHEHIVAGGRMIDFEVDTVDSSGGYGELDALDMSGGRNDSGIELITRIVVSAVTQSISATSLVNPVAYMDSLEKAIEKNWVLTTGEVRSLIGVKPNADREGIYRRGRFVFKKVGRIGRESGWSIQKI
jgi:hypothetical protein